LIGQHTKNQNKMKSKNDTLPSSVRRFLSEIGKRGGSASTDKKRLAAAINGLKGGRPRKVSVACEA
jgi:general stress protein YciG